LDAGDATLFIEGSVDDDLIEDLLFAFTTLDWSDFRPEHVPSAEVLPVYAVMKALFLPGEINVGSESKVVHSDARIPRLLAAGRVKDAAAIAVMRLRIASAHPLDLRYEGGVGPGRLAAALLIPVRPGKLLAGVLHRNEDLEEANA